MPSRVLFANEALLPGGWATDVLVEIDRGRIAGIRQGPPPDGAERWDVLLPGVPNLHSHAFQRLLAGLAESSRQSSDSFWSWRDLMYRVVNVLDPDSLEAVCTFVFGEMLRRGYTSVAEFHYLHNDAGGEPYADPAELSLRVVNAARTAGIGITHLPVAYERAGFDGSALGPLQRRLACPVERAVRVAETVLESARGDDGVAVGLAPHSLRAVAPERMPLIAAAARSLGARAPLHAHVAEQEREVADCLAVHGCGPVELLSAAVDLDDRWSLIHCTQCGPEDFARLAGRGVKVVLCPSTEANLGDGIVDLEAALAAGVGIGIGSDSQVVLGPAEEFRLLEYSQRLSRRRRNVAAVADRSVGRSLFDGCVASGEAALGRAVGRLAPGCAADLIELDRAGDPSLHGLRGDEILDAWIFASGHHPVRTVMRGGTTVVADGRHVRGSEIERAYKSAVDVIRSRL